eukprot:CAMPEP_0171324786 /NCGR_PEP_ID=MMETSP0816-20121228/116405_1 /TAXON_ID=420281 /ORGANISM="Proboscia inermis, Strain CCAP1064/1" /LENGTH=192 /DNA_ID=CAMNT_0011823813 /DNA_START=442 /DNA_END=1020 /DNA_ORIENTATION=-
MMKFAVLYLVGALIANTSAFTSSFNGANTLVRSTPKQSTLVMAMERTYIMVKPDGVQRGLVGNIINRFETKGYKLTALKTRMASAEILNQHYGDLVSKPFFPGMRDYMMSGPVCCMVWEGTEAVKTGRKMLGETNPRESSPGTIRGDYCLEVGRNICHGSDSVENAEKEIKLWFEPTEVLDWTSHSEPWVYE